MDGARVGEDGSSSALDQPHTFTYAPDFGKALAIVGTRDEALGQVWHVPSNAPFTQQQLVDMIGEEIGKPVKVLVAGKAVLTLLGLFNARMRELPEMMYEFTQPFIMDSSKFTRAFGVQATPMREAIRQTLAWARAHAEARTSQTKLAAF